ncbi:hypothetical protein [Geodermatophilus sp. DSM 44513]|uniref:hypothetical protein n=1 Tax=Geodermatophilus sp. DSM 44513 TaxID=1528104 RepID=UPI00127DF512|nr:hypothetical protein [Geodermatophilus sp. DSM 44513]WNV74346.1 hypothetical protein RTG05_15285 [Geodermatophilus sp. DSM 44513]
MTVVQQHDDLVAQRRSHAAWKLLAADNAPLIIGFGRRAERTRDHTGGVLRALGITVEALP